MPLPHRVNPRDFHCTWDRFEGSRKLQIAQRSLLVDWHFLALAQRVSGVATAQVDTAPRQHRGLAWPHSGPTVLRPAERSVALRTMEEMPRPTRWANFDRRISRTLPDISRDSFVARSKGEVIGALQTERISSLRLGPCHLATPASPIPGPVAGASIKAWSMIDGPRIFQIVDVSSAPPL